MDAVNLFKLASAQAKWLSLRQTTVASNIANANTPGYRSVDVAPFKAALDSSMVRLGATDAGHFGAMAGSESFRVSEEKTASLSADGKAVTLEDELVKSTEIRHSYEMNTAIVSAFHRMLMMTAKGS